MRKILLSPAEFIVAENLTYNQACEAVKKANEHTVGSVYTFYIGLNGRSEGWTLMARDTSWTTHFVSIPTDFIIEVSDEKV